MFRLRRLYLDSVGVADNRFSDLTVEMTDVSGQPADSIIWLRNGAGKTTMLSLLLALIRPDRRDFLAHKTKNRSLEDLILNGDTAHVAAEWVGPDGLFLLTGAVYEWAGRTRPQDYNERAGRDRLTRSWWCLTPEDGIDAATLDTLPFHTRSRGQFDRERFCGHVKTLAAQGASAVVVDGSIREWHEALRERRFDPGLFEYFLLVNAAEGGIDGLFADIDSPEKFVRYLLRFVGNHEQIEPVRDLLKDTSAEVAKRPMYLAEKEFCDHAQARLITLGNARAERDTAADTLAEEQLRAGRHKRALLDAAADAGEHATRSETHKSTIEDALSKVRTAADVHRSRSLHYLAKAAEYALSTAHGTAKRAREAATAAALNEKAWHAVEHHIDLATRRADLDAKKKALSEETQAAQPLRDSVDQARAQLAGALTREIATAGDEITMLDEQIEEQNALFESAQMAVDMAGRRRIEVEHEQTTIHTSIAEFNRRKRALIDRDILGAEERLTTAEQRIVTSLTNSRAETGRLETLRDQTEQQADTAATKFDDDQVAANTAQLALDRLTDTLDGLDARARQLADTPRIRTLMQVDDVDLAHETGDVITALEHAKAASEREIVEVNQALAAGERALHALKTTGLLPPRLQVQQIVDELAAASISAVPGWSYLAQHINPALHDQVIAELPAILDGVIVYADDLATVAGHITRPVDDIVVLAHSTVFDDTSRPAPQVILGPAPAQHDPTAAAAELDTRSDAQTRLAARHNDTRTQLRSDDALLSATSALERDLPDDGLDGLRTRTAVAKSALDNARQQVAVAKARRQELADAVKTIDGDLAEERLRTVRAETDLPNVAELRVTEADVIEPSVRRLNQIPADLTAADHQLTQALDQRRTAQTTASALQLHRDQTANLQRDWRNETAALPDPEPTDLALPAARTTVETAEQQLRAQFPEDTLRHIVTLAEREFTDAAARWNDHDDDVRARAETLAATTDANHASSRRAAHQRSAKAATDANVALGATKTALDNAQSAHDTAQRNLEGRRSRRDDDLIEPDDELHAKRLAAEAAAEVARLEDQRRQREQEITDAESIIATLTARSTMLADQASLRLSNVDVVTDDVDVTLPAEDDAVRTLINDVHGDLGAADTLHQQSLTAMEDCADELSRWAGDDKFAALANDEHGNAVRRLRAILSDKTSIRRVAENADTMVDDLRLRALQIAQQLKQVDETKTNIVSKITDLVLDALTVLRRASALSELPEGIGAWDRKHFLDVAPRANPTREQVSLRVGDLVEIMVNSRSIETDPAELLWRATHAAIPEGYRATVLKPSPEQSTTRIPVSDMRKWSGGENLTASLVLFCVMARLRAERRTEDRASSAGGVLPLDNPVGKANYLPFLELQRKVARANGVQLVYWTGIGDLGAVTAFPRIAAMHKRPSTSRAGRAYVTADQETSRQVLDVASAVRRDP